MQPQIISLFTQLADTIDSKQYQYLSISVDNRKFLKFFPLSYKSRELFFTYMSIYEILEYAAMKNIYCGTWRERSMEKVKKVDKGEHIYIYMYICQIFYSKIIFIF